jgi:hypothetical protein
MGGFHHGSQEKRQLQNAKKDILASVFTPDSQHGKVYLCGKQNTQARI